ncbi:MAG: DUF4192 domain-containing protein [Pseudonocardia sp.]|nr:DUF4192 domain-containing protein [Pseudonocardia sp.]
MTIMSPDLSGADELPVIRLRTPSDLVAAAPYLVGYTIPDHSLVIFGLNDAGQVRVSVCGEIPASGTGHAEMAQSLRMKLTHVDVTAIYVLAYGDHAETTLLLDVVCTELADHDIGVRDALRIHGGRYWFHPDTDPDGGPSAGIPLDDGDVAAQAIAAGCAPFPSRSAVAASIAPVAGDARAAMRAATVVAEELLIDADTVDPEHVGRDLLRASYRFLPYAADRYAAGGVIDDVQAALLAIALQSVPVRDQAISLSAHSDTRAYLALWTDLARRVEPAYRVPVLCLLAFTAWRDGGGPLATIAITEALRADPGYRLAQLIDQALACGLPGPAFDIPEPAGLPDEPGS